MKAAGIIVSIFVVAFTAHPLMSEILSERMAHMDDTEQSCCGGCADDCCRGAASGAAGDRNDNPCDSGQQSSDQGCADHCTCAANSVVVFNAVHQDQVIICEFFLEELETISNPYQFILPEKIWHPPRA